jgi:hypothetical protein
MRIRQIVKRINKSIIENSKEWLCKGDYVPVLHNSRGISVLPNNILITDKWKNNVEVFNLTDKEINFLRPVFNKKTKHFIQDENKLAEFIEKRNKRRGWLVKELLKSL